MAPGACRSFIIISATALFLVLGLVQNSARAEYPCPAVAETTFPQNAAQWITSFQKPYVDFLTNYSTSIVRQKMDPGILRPAENASRILNVSGTIGESDGSAFLSRLSVRFNLKNPTTAGMASAKLRLLRAGTAVTAYAAGKKAFDMANQIDSTLSGFTPTSFDFASKQQIQKDAAKLAQLRGLIQSQELRLLSLSRMLDSLGEGK